MPGIIDRYKREDFTISQRTGISDGKPVFGTITAHGFSLDYSRQDGTSFGVVHRGKTFYVAPLDSTPTLPCKITLNGVEYEAETVERLMTLGGELWGYKIVAFGG